MYKSILIFSLLTLSSCTDEPMGSEQFGDNMPDMSASTQTRLGYQVVMPGGLVNGQPPRNTLLLLEANLSELVRQLPAAELGVAGPWVFMVDIEPVWSLPAPGPDTLLCPLKLRFAMGSGGARHQLEIDAVGGAALQIPTAVCRVEVFWDRIPVDTDPGGALLPYKIPDSVIVRGTISRANIVPNARRSFYMPRSTAGTSGLALQNIPPYAFDYMVYSMDGNAFAVGANLSFGLMGVAGITIIDTRSGPQMAAAAATGARFPVPPGSNEWSFISAGATSQMVLVDFGVGF